MSPVAASVAQALEAVTSARCRCAHYAASHVHGAGPCLRMLPAVPEEELPEWHCPCRHFAVWPPLSASLDAGLSR